MDNNKSHLKSDLKTNAELRKMYPRDGAKIGMENGRKIGSPKNAKDSFKSQEL